MGPSLKDVQHESIRALLGNRCLSNAVLAINGAGAATIKTTVSPAGGIKYSLDGVIRSKADLAAVALATDATVQAANTGQAGYYVQPASKTVYYAVCLNSSGTPKVIQGTYDGQTFDPYVLQTGKGGMPNIGTDLTVIGYIKIVTGAATTFTPGTTLLDAAGLTVTFGDLSVVPNTDP